MHRKTTAALALLLLCTAAYPTGTWTALSGPPITVGEAAGLAWGSFPLTPTKDSIYLMTGHSSSGYYNKFYDYDVSTGLWDELANVFASATTTNDGALCFSPVADYERVLALTGDDDFGYFKHSSADGSWTQLTSNSRPHSNGTELTFGGTGSTGGVNCAWVYAFTGRLDSFMRYAYSLSPDKPEIDVSAWDNRAAFGSNPGLGSGLAFSKYTDNYEVYGTRGGGYQTFRGYDRANNSWTGLDPTPANVGTGGALTPYGIDDGCELLYGFRGDGSRAFWEYSISTDDWSTSPDDPTWEPGVGASLTYCKKNGLIYAVRGAHTTDFAVFDPNGGFCSTEPSPTEISEANRSLKCLPVGYRSFVLTCPAATGIPAVFAVVDPSGRVLWHSASTNGAVIWTPGTELPAGAYLAKVEALGISASGKLSLLD